MARGLKNRKVHDLSGIIPSLAGQKESGGLRKTIKNGLRSGATHAEIAASLLGVEDAKVRIDPKMLTQDAVIAKFISERPELALKNKKVLIDASRSNYSFDGSDHRTFAVWALVSSHLFYPEISGNDFHSVGSLKEADTNLKGLYSSLEKVLTNQEGEEHIAQIAQFTDFIASQTAKIRQMLDEEKERVMLAGGLTIDADKCISLLRASGYRVIALKDGEHIDPFALTVAAGSNERGFLIVRRERSGRLKVSMRAVKTEIGANLYRALNEEERAARRTSELADEWNGSRIAGGAPLDGTAIGFERLSMIVSRHGK